MLIAILGGGAGVPAGAERRGRSHRAHPVRRARRRPGAADEDAGAGAAMTTPDIYYKRSRFSTRLPWDRLYTASHFWVRRSRAGPLARRPDQVRRAHARRHRRPGVRGRRTAARSRSARSSARSRGSRPGPSSTRSCRGRSSAPTRPWRRRSTSSTPTATAPAGSTRSRAPPTPGRSTPTATRPCWTPPSTRCATTCRSARFAGETSSSDE